jgi:signal transduction histidine kinase
MALLGELVAGVVHEINTPIGNNITVLSTIGDLSIKLTQDVDSGALSKDKFYYYVSSIQEASLMLEVNLKTVASLVTNFKKVATDQNNEKLRLFDLKGELNALSISLQPMFEQTDYTYKLLVPKGIMMNSYFDPLGQAIINCFSNAIIHGFDGRKQGHINLSVDIIDKGCLMISIQDNGKGLSELALAKAFDPFVTTKCGEGGTRLGLNIVFSIVTTILSGSIKNAQCRRPRHLHQY